MVRGGSVEGNLLYEGYYYISLDNLYSFDPYIWAKMRKIYCISTPTFCQNLEKCIVLTPILTLCSTSSEQAVLSIHIQNQLRTHTSLGSPCLPGMVRYVVSTVNSKFSLCFTTVIQYCKQNHAVMNIYYGWFNGKETYRKISNIRRTNHQSLNVSCLVLQVPLHNILKPSVKWRMKM